MVQNHCQRFVKPSSSSQLQILVIMKSFERSNLLKSLDEILQNMPTSSWTTSHKEEKLNIEGEWKTSLMWKNQSALPYFYAFDRLSQFKFESWNLQFGGSGSFVFHPRLRVLFENTRCKNVGVKTLRSGVKLLIGATHSQIKQKATLLNWKFCISLHPNQRSVGGRSDWRANTTPC